MIFDPISSYFGQADTYKSAQVRAVLEPLAEAAARLNVAGISNAHLAKPSSEENHEQRITAAFRLGSGRLSDPRKVIGKTTWSSRHATPRTDCLCYRGPSAHRRIDSFGERNRS